MREEILEDAIRIWGSNPLTLGISMVSDDMVILVWNYDERQLAYDSTGGDRSMTVGLYCNHVRVGQYTVVVKHLFNNK